MIEIERKRQLTSSVDEFRKKLTENGFKTQDVPTLETDVYFSRPDVDYMQTVECLRLRVQPEKAEITYKPSSNKTTISDDGIVSKKEVNVFLKSVEEGENVLDLFDCIGLIRLCTVKKTREKFSKGDKSLTVSIDTIEGAGTFIEVEVMSEDKEHAFKTIEQVEMLLGIEDMPVQTKPYRDIVMDLE